MLAVEEARARILADVAPGSSEWCLLDGGLGRVLARDLEARRDQPQRAVSAMDGYAVRAADTAPGAELAVIGEAAAGRALELVVGAGEAARIFTGGVVPEGADAVLIQENAERVGERIRCLEPVEAGRFIRPAGLDYAKGWVGLERGTRLDARHLGLAASMGHVWLEVRQRPRVALIATGDELRWPGEEPLPHQITSSNTPCLAGLVRAWGGEPVDLGIVPDRVDALQPVLEAASAAEVIVTTGGASVGDHDLVQAGSHEAGLSLDFWKIRMRPGKPLIFGHLKRRPFLGFPGNPVSAAVCAIIFLRPLMRTMLGQDAALPTERLPLAAPLGPGVEREDYLRACHVRLDDGSLGVAAAPGQDSSMFATFAHADALIRRPPRDHERAAGDLVETVRLASVLN